MSNDGEELVPLFLPALCAVLVSAEDTKGEPLTYDEVIRIRDEASCIMMRVDHVERMAETRGYHDIDPENCWYDWQHLRRELGRKPDLDPGLKYNLVNSLSPEYQKTIQDAQNSLDAFRSMLPRDGSPRFGALVKTKILDGENSAFIWLSNTRMKGSNFVADLFEVPPTFNDHIVGDRVEVSPESLLDWMVNDAGVLHGGFSIRLHRSQLPENKRSEYDAYIGITEYA